MPLARRDAQTFAFTAADFRTMAQAGRCAVIACCYDTVFADNDRADLRRRQVERVFTISAICIKYSSQLTLIFIPPKDFKTAGLCPAPCKGFQPLTHFQPHIRAPVGLFEFFDMHRRFSLYSYPQNIILPPKGRKTGGQSPLGHPARAFSP